MVGWLVGEQIPGQVRCVQNYSGEDRRGNIRLPATPQHPPPIPNQLPSTRAGAWRQAGEGEGRVAVDDAGDDPEGQLPVWRLLVVQAAGTPRRVVGGTSEENIVEYWIVPTSHSIVDFFTSVNFFEFWQIA